jgi:hypothetical protein
MNLIDNWAKKHRDVARINFVFDRGNRRRTAFEKSYDRAYRGKDYFGGLAFEDDKRLLPLQAADFVAYELSKAWTSHKIDQRFPRATFELASQTIRHNWRVADSPRMLQAPAKAEGVS